VTGILNNPGGPPRTPDATALSSSGTARTYAFCDPGLDRVSIAIFRLRTAPRQAWDLASMQDKLKTLVRVRAFKTAPSLALPERLLLIAQGVHEILTSERATRFFMETPRFAGTYSRVAAQETRTVSDHGGKAPAANAKGLMLTHHASGAILAAAMTVLPTAVAMVPVLPAGRGNGKKERLERVRMLLVSIGRRAEITNQDDLDAVALGIGTTWPR
jgi:Holliday junction resolvasome RuvABC endonuclease subunit